MKWVNLFFIFIFSFSTVATEKVYKNQSFFLDNGVEIFLIHAPDAKQSAVSLTINIGSRNDPIHIQGLAHLLEHTVLLASDRYPDIGSFNQFFKMHNGWSNGSTRSDNTRYHFQLSNDAIEDGINRLADAIKNPILTDTIVQKAISEVDEEFNGKINDEWRGTLELIQNQMDKGYASSKFSVGNKAIFDSSKSTLVREIIKFHNQYYVGKNTKIVVYSNLSIEKQKQLSTSAFSSLPAGDKIEPQDKILIWESLEKNLLEVKSKGQTKSLDIMFPLPSKYFGEKDKTKEFILNYLGAETKGSLYKILFDRGLVTSLNTNVIGDSYYGILDIYFKLTDLGLDNIDTIITETFSYISALKVSDEANNFYKEIAYNAKMNANTKSEPGDWISQVNERMFRTNRKAWLDPSVMFSNKGVNSETLSSFLDYLQFNKMLLVKTHRNFTPDAKSRFYKLPYKLSNIQINSENESTLNDSYYYPPPNPFLEFKSEKTHRVSKLTKEELHYKGDGVNISLYDIDYLEGNQASAILLINDYFQKENSNTFLNRVLHSREVTNQLTDFLYYAKQADIFVRVAATSQGYQVDISGKPKYFSLITDTVLTELFNLDVIDNSFNIAKEKALGSINALINGQLQRRMSWESQNMLNGGHSLSEHSLQHIKHLTLDNYKNWKKNSIQYKDIEGVFSGNFTNLELMKQIAKFTRDTTVKKNERSQRVLRTKISSHYKDGYVSYIISAPKNVAFLMMLNTFLEKDFFKRIRSEKELGYFVGTAFVKSRGEAYITLSIQSSKLTSDKLENEINSFLTNYRFELESLTEQQFSRVKESLIKILKQKITKADEYSSIKIHESIYGFPQRNEIAQNIMKLDKIKFLELYQMFIINNLDNNYLLHTN